MDYRDSDRWLFQTRIRQPKDHPPVWYLAALLIGFIGAMAFVGRTDLEDVENIAQDEEVAHIKKQALMGIPCVYVCQKHYSHLPCAAKDTACVASADLTRTQ